MSVRKLASIVEIATCNPIPNTERLSVATMVGKGWRVVTGRDEFRPHDLAIYFEIDSALPADDDRYSFLHGRSLRKFVSKGGQVLRSVVRIKTVKLRGVVSQGLLMPLNRFPEVTDQIITEPDGTESILLPTGENGSYEHHPVVGSDITSVLHVEHYDDIFATMQQQCSTALAGDSIAPFPSAYAPKTDEERLQNLSEYFSTMKGRLFEITEKFDGTSTSIAYSPTIDPENPFVVCSRNNRLKEFTPTGGTNIYWKMARKYDIETTLKKLYERTGNEWMLQLESVGCGINGNRDRYTDNQMFCFRIWDIGIHAFVPSDVRRQFCRENHIPHVKVIADAYPFFDKVHTMDEALAFVIGKTSRGNEREGMVFKSCDTGPFVSFKVVSNKYLLKCED